MSIQLYVYSYIYLTHIKLPAKLLDYFSRNNKNNFNHYTYFHEYIRVSISISHSIRKHEYLMYAYIHLTIYLYM